MRTYGFYNMREYRKCPAGKEEKRKKRTKTRDSQR